MLQMLRRLVRQHEHHLILRRRLRPKDDEFSKSTRKHLLVLRAFATQLIKRVGFEVAGTAYGEALKLVVTPFSCLPCPALAP